MSKYVGSIIIKNFYSQNSEKETKRCKMSK